MTCYSLPAIHLSIHPSIYSSIYLPITDCCSNDPGFKVTKEQEEKISKKRALQSEYAHLEQLLVRYQVTEKNNSNNNNNNNNSNNNNSNNRSREAGKTSPTVIALDDGVRGLDGGEAYVGDHVASSDATITTVGLKTCDDDKEVHAADIKKKEEEVSAAAAMVGAPMNYSAWKNLFSTAVPLDIPCAKDAYRHDHLLTSSQPSVGCMHNNPSAANQKDKDIPASNSTHTGIIISYPSSVSNQKQLPTSNTTSSSSSSSRAIEDPFLEIRKGRKKASDLPSTMLQVMSSSSSSPPTTPCLSSATATGRTVLSPPLVKQPSAAATAAAAAAAVTPSAVAAAAAISVVSANTNTSAAAAAAVSNNNVTGNATSSSRHQFSLAQFINVSPKKASSSSSISSKASSSAAAINSCSDAVVSCSIASKNTSSSHPGVVVSSPPPPAAVALKAWNIVSPSTVSTPTSVVAVTSSLLLASKPTKSLLEIQREEELTRKQSNVLNLKGHENKWYVERRIRTDSIEFVMQQQEIERQEVMKQQEIERQEELELQRALKQVDDMKSKERGKRQRQAKKKKSTAADSAATAQLATKK